jgi:hypothetical protein
MTGRKVVSERQVSDFLTVAECERAGHDKERFTPTPSHVSNCCGQVISRPYIERGQCHAEHRGGLVKRFHCESDVCVA